MALGLHLWCLFLGLASSLRKHRTSSRVHSAALDHVTSRKKSQQLVTSNVMHPEHLHVIGDTHGDHNYLVRCLLSTELFALVGGQVSWRSDLRVEPKWQVVVLGDMINKGDASLKVVRLLKELSDDSRWGSRLVVTMGNHESGMLRLWGGYIDKGEKTDKWTGRKRFEDLKSRAGEGFKLMSWLYDLPVVYMNRGVLLMHGGLSEKVSRELTRHTSLSSSCVKKGEPCGRAMVDFVNALARAYFRRVHVCIQTASSEKDAKKCDAQADRPTFFLGRDEEEGVLWYRGYSKDSEGAGSLESCTEAANVGGMFGAQVMAVAHTTHPQILEHCGDNNVLVYLVDTHRLDCLKYNECDFSPEARFHVGGIDASKKNVPQSLRIAWSPKGARTISTCLSEVDGSTANVTVKCFAPARGGKVSGGKGGKGK